MLFLLRCSKPAEREPHLHRSRVPSVKDIRLPNMPIFGVKLGNFMNTERSETDIGGKSCPIRPDLRCCEHECVMDLLHGLLGRLMVLESRVARLEEE